MILGGAIFIQGCWGSHNEESISKEENDTLEVEYTTEIVNDPYEGMYQAKRDREIRDSLEDADGTLEIPNRDTYSVQYKVDYKYCDLCGNEKSISYELIDGNDDEMHQAVAIILSRTGNVQYLFGANSEDCSQSTTGNHRWEKRSDIKTLYLEKDPVDGHFKKKINSLKFVDIILYL